MRWGPSGAHALTDPRLVATPPPDMAWRLGTAHKPSWAAVLLGRPRGWVMQATHVKHEVHGGPEERVQTPYPHGSGDRDFTQSLGSRPMCKA